ncbi:MAG: hypothetical protein M0P07_03180 [Candidatus Methanomethylophilaceae archaeon]|nr:hypothetical protein [Candidatus Methanomethylophilaceae archaeon]
MKEADEKIEANLYAGKNAASEIETQFAARQVTNQMLIKNELLQQILATENKQMAVANLLRIKEEKKDQAHQKHNIFSKIDVDQLLKERENTEVQAETEKKRITEILATTNNGSSDEYDKILGLMKALRVDDESIASAKIEVENLILEPRI